MSWGEPREAHRAHAFTLIELAKTITAGLRRITPNSASMRAEAAASVLERALEDLEEALR